MNLENEIKAAQLRDNKSSIKKVFFYRICGTGMGACACLLKENGYDVEGADLTFSPPMSTYLESTGIPLFKLDEVDKNFLKKYDLIIVGNSVPRKSEYAQLIETCGVPFTSFPTVLGTLVLSEQNVVGIAGTHGKTTTTYFLMQMLEHLGKRPGYFIGGILNDNPPSRLGDGSYFVIESDEYDSAYFQKYSKFRQYEIDHLILTSLEFDHADIFNDITDIEKEFEAAIPHISQTFIISNDYASNLKLYEKFKKDSNQKWFLYGETSPLGPNNYEGRENGSTFTLNLDGSEQKFETNIVGFHNILNISACILFCLSEGFKLEEIKSSIKNLSLVKRRQEVRGTYKGAVVIDDFAHHPHAIELTIKAIRNRYPQKKCIVIFEPISATARSSVFQNEFKEALGLADTIILAKPSIMTTVKGDEGLDCEKIVSNLSHEGKEAYLANDLKDLRQLIDKVSSSNSLLLILSNRTCLGLWESDFVKELK